MGFNRSITYFSIFLNFGGFHRVRIGQKSLKIQKIKINEKNQKQKIFEVSWIVQKKKQKLNFSNLTHTSYNNQIGKNADFEKKEEIFEKRYLTVIAKNSTKSFNSFRPQRKQILHKYGWRYPKDAGCNGVQHFYSCSWRLQLARNAVTFQLILHRNIQTNKQRMIHKQITTKFYARTK